MFLVSMMLLLASVYFLGCVTLLGMYLVLVYIPWFPQFFKDLFYYGKVKAKTKSVIRHIEISKRSFLYFYLWGSIINFLTIILSAYFYIFQVAFPSFISCILRLSLGNGLRTQTSALSSILVLFMITLQCHRRYNECLNTSIFSHSTINLLHFLLGIFLYSTFPLSVLTQSILPESNKVPLWSQISYQHILGFLLFLIASFTQRTTHKKLADLRIDKKTGKVKDLKHHIPRGWMFEYVSCPHFLSEIFIYYSFCFVDSFKSEILIHILLFVIVNQIITAHMNHAWYKRTFPDYPQERKAIIPYLL